MAASSDVESCVGDTTVQRRRRLLGAATTRGAGVLQDWRRGLPARAGTGDEDGRRGQGSATRTGGEGGGPAATRKTGEGGDRRPPEGTGGAAPRSPEWDMRIQPTAQRRRRELGVIQFFCLDPTTAWLRSNGPGSTGRNFRPARRRLVLPHPKTFLDASQTEPASL